MVFPYAAAGLALSAVGLGFNIAGTRQAHKIASMQLKAQANSLETQAQVNRLQTHIQRDMLKANQYKNNIKLNLEKFFINKSRETNDVNSGLWGAIIEQNSSIADLSALYNKSKAYEEISDNYYSFVNRGFTLASGASTYRSGSNDIEKYYYIEELKRQSVKQEQKTNVLMQKHSADMEYLQKETRIEQQILDDDMNYLSATLGINVASYRQQMEGASASVQNMAGVVSNNLDTMNKYIGAGVKFGGKVLDYMHDASKMQ